MSRSMKTSGAFKVNSWANQEATSYIAPRLNCFFSRHSTKWG